MFPQIFVNAQIMTTLLRYYPDVLLSKMSFNLHCNVLHDRDVQIVKIAIDQLNRRQQLPRNLNPNDRSSKFN